MFGTVKLGEKFEYVHPLCVANKNQFVRMCSPKQHSMLGDDIAKAADCILSRRGGGAPSPAGLRRRCSDANGGRAPACSVVVVANEEYAVVRGGRVVESGGVRVVESGRQEFRRAAAQLEWRPASVTNEWKRRRLETEKTKK